MALKRDFTHLIDVLQKRLQQMKYSFDEITGRSQRKLDANRLFWPINDNFVFLTPKGAIGRPDLFWGPSPRKLL